MYNDYEALWIPDMDPFEEWVLWEEEDQWQHSRGTCHRSMLCFA
jgi:hypothetical protein